MKTKKANRISVLLLAGAMLMLSACSVAEPEPQPTATPEPTGIDLWVQAAEERYNMEYDGFAGYWDSMCDGFYGDSVKTVLSVIRFDDKDKEVAEKRAEYADKYGDDWRYTVVDRSETQLDEKACGDFADELEDISKRRMCSCPPPKSGTSRRGRTSQAHTTARLARPRPSLRRTRR